MDPAVSASFVKPDMISPGPIALIDTSNVKTTSARMSQLSDTLNTSTPVTSTKAAEANMSVRL